MLPKTEFAGERQERTREPVRILLLEDDPIFAELLAAHMRTMQWVRSRLEVVQTLAAARERLQAEKFGLVITDLNLPDASGLATVEALARAGEQLVIVLTGSSDPALRAGALECGAYDFLSKDNLSAAGLERLVRLAAWQASTLGALRESEGRFRSLISLSSEFYWESDPQHRVVKIDHGSEKHPVANRSQLGKARWETPSVYPDAEGWAAHRATMDAHLPFRDFEIARTDADGVLRWRAISGEPVFDGRGAFQGYRGAGKDITARKRAEEELQRFRLALDTSPDMILLISRGAMRLVDVNTTACRLLGYSREELLRMGPQDILPLPRAQLEGLYDRMIADPSVVTGMRSYYRCKDGTRLAFESTRRVLRSGDDWLIAAISRDIRQRIADEEALRESEARFRSLSALSSDWYWEQDAEFRLTYMSSIEKTGLDASAYLGLRRWEQPALNLSEADWEMHRAQLERHEPFRDFEIERPAQDGGSVWISLSGEPVFDAEGRFTGYRGVGRDITARKRGENDVVRLGRMYRALGAANEAILRATSQQEVFERSCEIAVAAGDFVLGIVYLLDPHSRTLSRVAASGAAAALEERVQPSIDESQPGGKGLIGYACRSGQPVISNDYAADPKVRRVRDSRPYPVGSVAVFPLSVDGELAGVFGLQHARKNAFTEELTGLLQRLADNISFALQNFRQEALRRKAKRKLGQSEQRFRSLTALSSDTYWEQDAEYRFTSFSGTTPDALRAGRDHLIGRRRWDQHYFNMSEADWAAHRALLEARKPFHELELGRVSEAGEKLWISVSGEPFFDDDGRFLGYRGIGRDITARKRAAQLRELEHTVTRSLAQTNSVSVADALRAAIRAICEAEGWECGRYFSADDATGVLRFSVAWGVEHAAVQSFIAGSREFAYPRGVGFAGRVWQTGEPLWVPDVAADERSGQRALARASGMRGAFAFPVIAEGRTIGVLGFNSRDVRQPDQALLQAIGVIGDHIGQFVQRKQAEADVRESEARFRSLTALSSDWYWQTDAEHRFVNTPARVTQLSGMKANAYVGKCRWEVPGLSPLSGDWTEHRAILARRESYRDFDLVQVRADGERVYLQVSGEPRYDADGRFQGYHGTARDITVRRRSEDELRRFRAAMDMAHDAIYLTDRSTMRFLDVNEVGCKSLGYRREELIGMPPYEVLPVSREQLEREYDDVIASGAQGVRVESSYVRKDGRKGWSELFRRALRSGEGWIIVTISRDISERRRAEESQAAHLRYQERIARFGQAALVKSEPAELVTRAAQAVLEALGAEVVAYIEPDPRGGGMTLRTVLGLPHAENPGPFPSAPGDPVSQAMSSGSRVVADGAALPFVWAREMRSAALIPVRGDQSVRGLLCVCHRHGDGFGAEELNFVDAAASVLSTALQRIDSEGRLAYLAQFDTLTGLPNRALLADRFSQMIVQAKRREQPLAVLFIDLDEFKLVNDTLGHAGGDALLKEIAVRLQSAVRGGDTVARISGDEFAIVLADLARTDDAAIVAQKVIDRVGAAVDVHGNEVFVTASVGIAAFPADGSDAETLLSAADAAMYRAKQSGRNAYQFFTAEINQRTRARAHLGTELRRALEREEFVLAYQPKVRLADRRPDGAEALLRWRHPERGIVSPAEFIPVLEETGLIVAVGEWVIRQACADLKAWKARGLEVESVAINLSARQFRQPDLHQRITALIREAGVEPARIELEITESQVMHDPDHAVRLMRALRDAGMRLAIDDFGTGYSSLAYLTRFPVGALKIDRSFVKEMVNDKADATIVRTIIEMAHTLGFTVVAEGVEGEEQANFLRLLRCEQAQGYLFARPMSADEFVTFCSR